MDEADDPVLGQVTVTHRRDGLTIEWWHSSHLSLSEQRQMVENTRSWLRNQPWPNPPVGSERAIELQLRIQHVPQDVVKGMDPEPFGSRAFKLRIEPESDDETTAPLHVLWDALTIA